MATWKIVGGATFNQDIDETSAYQEAPLGTRVQARDIDNPGYGTGEFVYAKGVGSTAAGDLVFLDTAGYTAARSVETSIGPCAVAMSANVDNYFGWYCIYGTVEITSGTVADGAVLFLTTTAGSVDDASVNGDLIFGANAVAATSGGKTLSSITYPFVNQKLPQA